MYSGIMIGTVFVFNRQYVGSYSLVAYVLISKLIFAFFLIVVAVIF